MAFGPLAHIATFKKKVKMHVKAQAQQLSVIVI
jgi:hypothetical protein